MSDRTDNVCCVKYRKHSSMPTPPRSRWAHQSRGESRQRVANNSDSSPAERSARTATRGCMGAISQSSAKSGGEVSDQHCLSSESGQFRECSALERNVVEWKISGMSESWPVSRLLLPVSCPRAETRGLLLTGRTKSRGHPGRKRFCAGLDCLRPSERAKAHRESASRTGVHCSGSRQRVKRSAKLSSPAAVAG